MAESGSDTGNGEPGGDTAMFQAFVNSSEKYQERQSGPKGPIVVALVALAIAVIAFVVIVAVG